MEKKEISNSSLPEIEAPENLLTDIRVMIDEARKSVAISVNSVLTLLYWKIGVRLNDEILQENRAEYGKQILATVSQQLTLSYGNLFSYSSLTRMVKFAEYFSEKQNIVTLSQILSWSHFVELVKLNDSLHREFYTEMCRLEGWSVRTLRKKLIPCFLKELLFLKSLKNLQNKNYPC